MQKEMIDHVVINNKFTKVIFAFDTGHGGLIDGVYQIRKPGSKQFKHPEFTFYEGVYNRQIKDEIISDLQHNPRRLNYVDLTDIYGDSQADFNIPYRCQKINELVISARSEGYEIIGISFHGNAGGGTGFEIFTSPGFTFSDVFAEVSAEECVREFPDEKFRSDNTDGDMDKEAHFMILTDTMCPMILVENGFFDNIKDAVKMRDPEFRARIVKAQINAMERVVIGDI